MLARLYLTRQSLVKEQVELDTGGGKQPGGQGWAECHVTAMALEPQGRPIVTLGLELEMDP